MCLPRSAKALCAPGAAALCRARRQGEGRHIHAALQPHGSQVYNYTRRGLFDRDKLIVLTLLTFTILLRSQVRRAVWRGSAAAWVLGWSPGASGGAGVGPAKGRADSGTYGVLLP